MPGDSGGSPSEAISERSLKLAQVRVELKQALLDMARMGRLSRLARKRERLRAKNSKSSTRTPKK
jgi:hypothetical protein